MQQIRRCREPDDRSAEDWRTAASSRERRAGFAQWEAAPEPQVLEDAPDDLEVAPEIISTPAQKTKIGFPVTAKILSPDVLHKTDAGGVVLDIANAVQLVAKAWSR